MLTRRGYLFLGHYGERRSTSRLSRRASGWNGGGGEAPADEHAVPASDGPGGDPAGDAGATAAAAADTMDPAAADAANIEAQEAVLEHVVNRAVADARAAAGPAADTEKRVQNGFRRADSGAHPGKLLSQKLSQTDSGVRTEPKTFEKSEEHGTALDRRVSRGVGERNSGSGDAADEARGWSGEQRLGRGQQGDAGRDSLEWASEEEMSDFWADESEEGDAERQWAREEGQSCCFVTREGREREQVETVEEDSGIVAASTTGEGETSSGASTTSREGATRVRGGHHTLRLPVKLENDPSVSTSRSRWKRTGGKRYAELLQKSYEAIEAKTPEGEWQSSSARSFGRNCQAPSGSGGDHKRRPASLRTEKASQPGQVALKPHKESPVFVGEDRGPPQCNDQAVGTAVSARSRVGEEGADPFDYTAVPVRQLVRIFQRQHRVGSVLSWVNEELRGRRPPSAHSTLFLRDGQLEPSSAVAGGEEGLSGGRESRLLERIKEALRHNSRADQAERPSAEDDPVDGGNDDSVELSGAGAQAQGDLELSRCTGATQERFFLTDTSHGAAEEVESEGKDEPGARSPTGAEEPENHDAGKGGHSEDANGQRVSRRNTRNIGNDGMV